MIPTKGPDAGPPAIANDSHWLGCCGGASFLGPPGRLGSRR